MSDGVLGWPLCRTHRCFKTDGTNRGKEAPVFESQDSLVFDPSSPKTQVTECQISSLVCSQRIPGVVCSFLETKSLSFRLLGVPRSYRFFSALAAASGGGAPLWGAADRSDPVFIETTY